MLEIPREGRGIMTTIKGNFEGIDFTLTPRTDLKQSGYLCLPIVKNIPAPLNRNWEKIRCPNCGTDCWLTPAAKVTINRSKGKLQGVCTECALRAGMKSGAKGKEVSPNNANIN